MLSVASWRIRVIIVAMKTQQFVPIVLLSYMCHCQEYKILCVSMDTQQWVLFALLSRYRILRTAVSGINILRS